MAELRLVAGLGNPGGQYAHTRHNIGFMVLDRLAETENLLFTEKPVWHSYLARWGDVLLVKPMTFMNRSGDAIGPLARYYKIAPEQVLVVSDDAALPLGRLRLRQTGSDGGHNGLKSVIEHLGELFPRLRVGIGAVTGNDELVDHVLGKFSAEEKSAMEAAIRRAVEAIRHVVQDGIVSAMNLYNRAEIT